VLVGGVVGLVVDDEGAGAGGGVVVVVVVVVVVLAGGLKDTVCACVGSAAPPLVEPPAPSDVSAGPARAPAAAPEAALPGAAFPPPDPVFPELGNEGTFAGASGNALDSTGTPTGPLPMISAAATDTAAPTPQTDAIVRSRRSWARRRRVAMAAAATTDGTMTSGAVGCPKLGDPKTSSRVA
jgi:hypothetical protein